MSDRGFLLAVEFANVLAPTDAWVDAIAAADRSGVAFAVFRDSFEPTDPPAARLDAHLLATRLAVHTTRIGLLPTIDTTHTEPFHAAKNVASLDWITNGRAGVVATWSVTAEAAALFGRRPAAEPAVLRRETADFLEVLRRLWDSWEDGAIIRDRPTGRFIDRDRLHKIDFAGEFFAVRGPSITPRSPQGQCVVATHVRSADDIALAAAHADIAIVHATGLADAASTRAALHAAASAAGRDADSLWSFVALAAGAVADVAALTPWTLGSATNRPADGLLLRLADSPGAALDDLASVTTLHAAARTAHLVAAADQPLLRSRLGLGRPLSRYAGAVVS